MAVDYRPVAALIFWQCVNAFGKALSKSDEQTQYTDWHGAGAQRSSIKTLIGQDMTQDTTCSVNACDYNRSDNLVRCVR